MLFLCHLLHIDAKQPKDAINKMLEPFQEHLIFFIQQPFQEHTFSRNHSFSGVLLNLVTYICFNNIQSKKTPCFCFTSSQEHHSRSAIAKGGNKIFQDLCGREVDVHAKSITDVKGHMFKYHLN